MYDECNCIYVIAIYAQEVENVDLMTCGETANVMYLKNSEMVLRKGALVGQRWGRGKVGVHLP